MSNDDIIPITVHERINRAREIFHAKDHVMGGRNDFAKYSYFKLPDFLPDALAAFKEAGICGLISFTSEYATMKIVDVKTRETESITVPLSEAKLPGCHPVQNMGAVTKYDRRYLWGIAVELVEDDEIDSSKPKADSETGENSETLPKDKFIEKKFPQKPRPRAVEFEDSDKKFWFGHILSVEVVKEGESASGPWKLYAIKMDQDRSATTLKEALANDAKIIGKDVKVRAIVEPNKRSPGNWSWLNFEPAPKEETLEEELGWQQ